MLNLDTVFDALEQSTFRQKFHLNAKDAGYLQQKGLPTILLHAHQFIGTRLAPAEPAKDGKQTPFKGHPVFVAQHATATCCRSCLAKWHHIPKGIELSSEQQDYVVSVIERWLLQEAH
jgi:hypothetical protein